MNKKIFLLSILCLFFITNINAMSFQDKIKLLKEKLKNEKNRERLIKEKEKLLQMNLKIKKNKEKILKNMTVQENKLNKHVFLLKKINKKKADYNYEMY